jgi:hypothetical protein
MPLTNANLLTEDRLARWLIENSPVKIQIARVWPFLGVAGGMLTYARQNLALNAAGTIIDGSPVADSSDAVSSVTYLIQEFITRYSVNFADQDRYEDPNDLDATEYALALRRLLYGYFAFLDLPAGSGGLIDLLDPVRSIDVSGGALTLDCMDHAYNLVVANDGRPTVIMTSSRGLRSYSSLCREAGFEPPKVPWRWYNPATGEMDECEVIAFNGTPILINDMMASANSPLPGDQRIWFIVLGDDGASGPTRGVTGFVPRKRLHDMFVKRETNGVPDFVAQVVNTTNDVWVSWPVGLATGSQGALSLIHNFTPVADCGIG